MIDEILFSFGITKTATVGGFIGSVVSLRFLGQLTLAQGAFALFCGTASAAYVSPLAMQILDTGPRLEGAISFLIGVFGLILGSAIVRALPEALTALRKKFIGGE